MSVKCGYSNKYYPLLIEVFSRDTSETKDKFKGFVENNFIDPDSVYRMFMSGVDLNSTQTPVLEVEQVSSRTGLKIKTDSDSAQQFYIGENSQYNKMSDSFIKTIISLTIYDLDTNTFPDPNKIVGDVTSLNKKIFDYKKFLLSNVLQYIGDPLADIESLSNKDIENYFNTVLNKFGSSINHIAERDANFYKAYNAFIILKTFDNLLNNLTPFVKVDPKYAKASSYSKQRYYYAGPNVRHYTGFSLDEYASIDNSMSDLSQILLNYFPQVNSNGEIIENTSISSKGFNSVMSKLKMWSESSTSYEVQEEVKKGTLRDVGKLIDLYIKALDTNKDVSPENITYLRSTLAGIRRFIYSPNMDQNIKNMFTNLIDKTVPSSYISYTKTKVLAPIEMKNITERVVYMQGNFIDEVVEAASLYWQVNRERFKTILRKHSITVLGNEVKIGNAVINRDPSGTITINGPISNFSKIVEEISQLIIENNFNNIAAQVFSNNITDIQLFAPIIGTIILNVNQGTSNKVNYGQKRDLAKVLSVINGSDAISVIKNSEGNNLPLYQLICLAYSHRNIYNEIISQIEANPEEESLYESNPVFTNLEHVKSPKIRSEVVIEGVVKQSSELNANDVMHLAVVYDFYQSLVTKQSASDTAVSKAGIVGLQVHTYSDKSKHFVMQFDLNKTWNFGNLGSINFKIILDKYFKSADKNDLNPIMDLWFQSNRNQINSIVNNILNDYKKAVGKTFNNLSELKLYLSKNDINVIRAKFAKAGVEFINEIHASKINKKWTINETIENFISIFSNRNKFDSFISAQFNQFLNDSSSAWETICVDKATIKSMKETSPRFVDKNKLIKILDDGTVNPLLYSYYIIDTFLSNEYNKMMVGNVFLHPNKNNESPAAKNYFTHSLASRWNAQVKRMVILGATYHPYAQGLKNGVPERVKMAVMPDVGADVSNIVGMSSTIDSMDGSGYTSPFLSRMQNVSLIDAAVGANKKTIYHDIDSRYGRPKLLKWAEYEITNALRRNSQDVSLENIFKKMHNFSLSQDITYERSFNNLYYRDKNTGKYFKISKVSIVNGQASVTKSEVNALGEALIENPSDANFIEVIDVKSIYDIDQVFGGAWAMGLNPLTNKLQYSEKNLDYTNEIICDFNLKDRMIGWVVNTSAIKVGASNLNLESSWYDDSPLLYTDMSTKFGGLQMDADHALDDAEVTEMTQMISGLEQNGFTHDIATEIYADIGRFCYDAISNIQEVIYNDDKNELYKIFGKAVISAFKTGTKDTLGLAQSFVKIAQKSLNEGNIEYRIPFSSSSINGIFNSTVTSSLVRDAIRRHYSGVPAVLNPSYNVVQYYTIDGNNYRYEELIDKINSITKGTTLEGLDINTAINNVIITDSVSNEIINPFIIDVTDSDPIDFEDTIVVFNTPNEDGTYTKFGEITSEPYEVVKINNYETYDYYKHYETRRIMRWILKPKNLKGSDTVFSVNGKKYSMFESPITKVLHYFIEADLAANDLESLKDELKKRVVNELKNITSNQEIIDNVFNDRLNSILTVLEPFMSSDNNINLSKIIPIIKKNLRVEQQNLLNSLSELKPLKWENEILIPESYSVIPAQIVMGKLYAKELGLLPGDSIANIKSEGWEFFKNRISGYYAEDNPDPNTFDWTLFDGTGNKLYVKLRTPQVLDLYPTSSPDSDYQIIEGTVYFKDKEICSSDGKQFITYLDEYGDRRTVVIIDDVERLNELKNSKAFSLIQQNYRLDNYKELVREEFGVNELILLNVRDEKGKWVTKNIAEFNDVQHIVNALAENQDYLLERKIKRLAQAKFDSFEKSLKFVATRIPCQSMQSFMPCEIVTFVDSDVNEVYIPTNQTWLQGSDYDIDKSYILGYSVSPNGYINTDEDIAPYLRRDALRNKIVDNIFNVILNPKNQINLTLPITVDRVKELSNKSLADAADKVMGPYNPASKFLMQIQNMIGKSVIGNVATAIKSFFALSNIYNTKFNEIYYLIREGKYDEARDLLNKYTFKYNNRIITLANVNIDIFNNLLVQDEFGEVQIDPNIPNDIREIITSIINFENSLEDQSMLLGELLNSATDNAKELILKKINADTNWVDIYTISFMLGDTLNDVGKLMLDKDITELVSNYNSSVFSGKQNIDKIRYIKNAISESNDIEKRNKFEKLLEKAIAADELRILGKILKINQGLPTNTVDLYRYIKSIEKYIESRYNKELLDPVESALNDLLRLGNAESLEEEAALKRAFTIYKEAKRKMNENWVSFDLIRFIIDSEYKAENINKYDKYKVNFNILDVINTVPHFREMFKVLALNKEILNNLSVRNRLEDIILNQTIHKPKSETGSRSERNPNKSRVLDKEEIWEIKNAIDKHLINSWIISKNISVTKPANSENEVPDVIRLDNEYNIEKFRIYVENYAIPLLKQALPNNRFISLLTFGVKDSRIYYKLPFNMTQIDNTQRTKSLYEEALYAFNNLSTIKVEGININLVDLFYLYNLIVNQDKFGHGSLTRIFEDLISAEGNEKLLVYDFNNWIDNQDVKNLVYTFDNKIKIEEYIPIIEDNRELGITNEDTDISDIGFKSSSDETDYKEALYEEGIDEGMQKLAEEWSKKEGWSVEYFNKVVEPKLNEAWQLEYKVSEDQESPVQLEGKMTYRYNGQQRQDISAKTTINAIKLGEKTATTYYESDKHISYWRQAKVGDRIKFYIGKNPENRTFVIVEATKPLTKLVPDKQLNLFAHYYDTAPSIESKLIALVKTANIKGLHIVYDSELVNEDISIRNAKGFISNGEIFINADRATDDTIIHEFGHLYLADAKLQHPDEYYNLLTKVRDTYLWRVMRDLSEYNNKRGSDFDEEVLASLIDRSYKAELDSISQEIVNEALNLVSPEYTSLLKSDILPVLSDTFISNYKEQQKLATIKNKLIKDNVIKEDCK